MAKETENTNNGSVEEIIETQLKENSVIVVNIKYAKISRDGTTSKRKNLPEFFVLDLPERITQLPDKSDQKYLDLIETFVYNTLSKKFQTDVEYCQIWIQ